MKEIPGEIDFRNRFFGPQSFCNFLVSSYLSSRYQRVRYDGSVSELLPVKCTSGFDLGTCAFYYLH